MKKETMTKIFNVNVYGLKESVIASGYPMISETIGDMFDAETGIQITEKDMKRCITLGTVPTGTGHDNFLKGIVVQFDITYPVYWSPQFQRYHFADVVSSTSAMHRINKVDLDICTNKYVSKKNNEKLSKWIEIYNKMEDGKKGIAEILVDDNDDFDIKDYAIFNLADVSDLSEMNKLTRVSEETGAVDADLVRFISKKYDVMYKIARPDNILGLTKYEVYMKIISNAPQGLMKTMRITTNYLQLKTIYQQRKTHKLKEDWGVFCDWIITLPYFNEYCIKGYAVQTVTKYLNIIKAHHNGHGGFDRYRFNEIGKMENEYQSILEFVDHKHTNKTKDVMDSTIHLLYVQGKHPEEIDVIESVDENDKPIIIVYPSDIKAARLLDVKLEIIEGFKEQVSKGYIIDKVINK